MPTTNWFQDLFGFPEAPEAVYANLTVDGEVLTSRANGHSYRIGTLETPTLAELRDRTNPDRATPIRVRNVAGEAGAIHRDSANTNALIQAASQFNLLEMVSPNVTPEQGVTDYAHDHTQGPACAMAAAAATVYRNYFVPIGNQVGQTADRQIDCTADMHALLSPGGQRLWELRNGYALLGRGQAFEFAAAFAALDNTGRDQLRSRLRIGLHWDVETTHPQAGHLVSQAYCSALPLGGYQQAENAAWRDFATLILEGLYEATLLAAIENADRHAGAPVFLTSVGGGVFGNDERWIINAMHRAFDICANSGLDVRIVNYRHIRDEYRALERG